MFFFHIQALVCIDGRFVHLIYADSLSLVSLVQRGPARLHVVLARQLVVNVQHYHRPPPIAGYRDWREHYCHSLGQPGADVDLPRVFGASICIGFGESAKGRTDGVYRHALVRFATGRVFRIIS